MNKWILKVILWTCLTGRAAAGWTIDGVPVYPWCGGGTNAGALAPEWMEIMIPLNPAGLPGNWTDFELKIFQVPDSMTPWRNDHGDGWPVGWTNNMVYYHQTWGVQTSDVYAVQALAKYGDSEARVYYIDDHRDPYSEQEHTMYMRWSLATNNVPLHEQLVSTNSVVDYLIFSPSKDGCGVDWTGWQYYTNRHRLRASFLRQDALGAEMNKSGTRQRWHPVPIHWVPRRISENDDG